MSLYTDRAKIVGMAQNNVDNAIPYYNYDVVQALEAEGYQYDTARGYWIKITNGRSESVRDQEYLDLINSMSEPKRSLQLNMKVGGVYVDNTGVFVANVGPIATVGHIDDFQPIVQSIGAFFGYVISGQAIEDSKQFFYDAFQTIFPGDDYSYMDKLGNFYVSKEALERAYEVFSNLPGSGESGIWLDGNGNRLNVTFGKSVVLWTPDEISGRSNIQTQLYTDDATNLIYCTYRKRVSGNEYFRYGIYAKKGSYNAGDTITTHNDLSYTVGGVQYNIPRSDVYTYPSTDGDYDVTLGGVRYRCLSLSDFGDFGSEVGTFQVLPTPPFYTYENDDPKFLVGVTEQGGTPISMGEIPGVAHPTSGGTLDGTYPTWKDNKKVINITDDGTPGDDPKDIYPFTFLDPDKIPDLDDTDVDNIRRAPEELPDPEDKDPYVDDDWIDRWFSDDSEDNEDESEGDGQNPDVPDGESNAGQTPDDGNVPSETGSNSGFVAVYHPTKAIVRTFCAWLWGVGFDLDTFKKLFQDPMSSIISLHEIFVSPKNGPGNTTIKVGFIDTQINTLYSEETVVTLDCGTIKIPEYYNNCLDYEPYTEINIFLPFIGFRRISPNDVIGNNLTVKYTIDVLTGACVADLTVDRGNFRACLYSFNGNCSVQVPLSSSNFNSVIGNLAGTIASGVATLASGGLALPLFGASLGNLALNSRAQIERGGSLSGNFGALTYRKPFVIVKRPTGVMPYNYQKFIGYPTSKQIRLGLCEGYTRVKECHLDSLNATEQEKQELDALLKKGIII